MPILTSVPGKRYRFRKTEFWAERGLVHQFDYRVSYFQPDYTIHPVRKMLQFARSVNRCLPRMKYADERVEHEKLVADLIACCAEAQRQGRPDDPKTFEHLGAMRRDKHFLKPGEEPWRKQSLPLSLLNGRAVAS